MLKIKPSLTKKNNINRKPIAVFPNGSLVLLLKTLFFAKKIAVLPVTDIYFPNR